MGGGEKTKKRTHTHQNMRSFIIFKDYKSSSPAFICSIVQSDVQYETET